MKNIFIILLLCSFQTSAQYNTNIQLQLGSFASPQDIYWFSKPEGIINNIGGSFSHKLSNNIGIKVGGHTWYRPTASTISPDGHKTYLYQEAFPSFNPSDIDKTALRYSYTEFDIMPVYSYRKHNNQINVSAGISYAFGKNSVLSSVTSFGPGYDVIVHYTEVKAHYWGAVWEVGYNYYLFKQRFNVGMSLSGRYYFKQFQEYNLKLCFGYNFNVAHKHNTARDLQ